MPGTETTLHHDAVAALERAEKTERGQFFTMANPFTHPAFASWLSQVPAEATFVEPFAGANNLVRMVTPMLTPDAPWRCYDIEPQHPDVIERDTIADYPHFDTVTAVITNPPYLAKNMARRHGMHHVADLCGPFDNLYKKCLDVCLNGSEYVAAIIPESFITSGHFRERLQSVVSLTQVMFVDTEVPVCLALWGPEATNDFTLYAGEQLLGSWHTLASLVPEETPTADRLRFNDVNGLVGVLACDTPAGPTIRFTTADLVPAESVKPSARTRTRIAVEGLDPAHLSEVLDVANTLLDTMRMATNDVTLTAFMGLRKDGRYRRRLDFATTRRLLAAALDQTGR